MPRFSIVLPAYNAEPFIQQTIGSILSQTYQDFEIIVVDDGSSDATGAVAAAMDPRVRVLKQRNSGIALARNAGIGAARADWIAFMDHDDLWHPQKLAVQAETLERDTTCAIVYGEFKRWDPSTPPQFNSETLEASRVDAALSGSILHRLVQTNWVLLSTAVIRKQVFEKVGLFDPKMPPADDWDLVMRAAEHFRFVKLAQQVALYRVHPGQTSLKLTATNIEYELRLRGLARLRTLGGPSIDRQDINSRQFRALWNYGLAQYKAGLYRQSCPSFFGALRYNKVSGKAAAYLVMAYMRSIAQTAGSDKI
jgi:glycosyltransferase involved in cell wall biosynthesis